MKQWMAAVLCTAAMMGSVQAATDARFIDVAPDAYYAEAVDWAVDQEIARGTGGRQFHPEQVCTIGEAVTFLWRACGAPAPAIANPYTDVSDTAYYAAAACWAWEKGLISTPELGADRPCPRRTMLTYLWKLAGSPTVASSAPAGETAWNLLLVNPWNPMPEAFSVELASVGGGHKVDARCAEALLDMLSDCRAAGLSPAICSSYRTWEVQASLFSQRVASRMAQGMTREAAEARTAQSTAVPGTSEHQIGLAVDLVDSSNWRLDSSQASMPAQRWLMRHSWEYGFILRYPEEKSDITGIIYEPWHYRYVGRDAAQTIYEQGLCLEEYLQQMAEFELAAAWGRSLGITTSTTAASFLPNANCTRAQMVTFLWRTLEP